MTPLQILKKNWLSIILTIGAVWIAVGILNYMGLQDPISLLNFRLNSGYVNGIITHTEHSRDVGDNGTEYFNVHFNYEYTVDGVKYKKSDFHSSTYPQPDIDLPYKCKVRYIKSNPNNSHLYAEDEPLSRFIFLLLLSIGVYGSGAYYLIKNGIKFWKDQLKSLDS